MQRMVRQAWHNWGCASVKWGHGQQCNKLKLNDSKTEFLVISSKHSHQVPDVSSISIGDAILHAIPSTRNIGAVLDDKLTIVAHVSSVCKFSYAHHCSIAQIRRYLNHEATASLIDNLNSLLFGLPDNIIVKSQCIQNHSSSQIAVLCNPIILKKVVPGLCTEHFGQCVHFMWQVTDQQVDILNHEYTWNNFVKVSTLWGM